MRSGGEAGAPSGDRVLVTGGSGFIGTNLVDCLLAEDLEPVNFDIAPPHKPAHRHLWLRGDLLAEGVLSAALAKVQPRSVIHLAARTDTDGRSVQDYRANTEGTRRLIEAVERERSVERLIVTSTQYVYKASDKAPFPSSDTDYRPHTAYGESKVETESLTRSASLGCTWTIVRPANIWGPWHMRYPVELWRYLDRGLYVHPATRPVVRTYGYVKNVAFQLLRILAAPRDEVAGRTFYLGDPPIDSYLWLNTIARVLRGRDIRRVPSGLLALPARTGDLLRRIGVPAPLYSSRLRNMLEDYPAPTAETVAAFGQSHPDLEANVRETVQWIRSVASEHFPGWRTTPRLAES